MGNIEERYASIRAQIAETEAKLARLKLDLANNIEQAAAASTTQDAVSGMQGENNSNWPLLDEEYKRYGRQMIVEKFGLQGLFLLPDLPKAFVENMRPANIYSLTQVNLSLNLQRS